MKHPLNQSKPAKKVMMMKMMIRLPILIRRLKHARQWTKKLILLARRKKSVVHRNTLLLFILDHPVCQTPLQHQALAQCRVLVQPLLHLFTSLPTLTKVSSSMEKQQVLALSLRLHLPQFQLQTSRYQFLTLNLTQKLQNSNWMLKQ